MTADVPAPHATRRVLLHVGQPKTGTSAIQVWLAQNRGALRDDDVNYPEHPSDKAALDGRVTSGNGVGTHRLVARDSAIDDPELVPEELAGFCEGIAQSPYATTLYSTEAMWNVDTEKLARLREALGDVGAALELIVYVRDIAPHAVSLYGQAVKRHGFTGTFSDFIGRTRPKPVYGQNVGERLGAWVDVLTSDAIHVIHYDSHKSNVLEPMLQVLGAVQDDPIVPPAAGQVNRSLTQIELEYMRRLNKAISGRARQVRASDELLRLPAVGAPLTAIGDDDARHLEATQSDHVDVVNELFFQGRSQLQLLGSTPVVRQHEAVIALSPEEDHLLAWLQRFLAADGRRRAQ